IPFLGGHGRLPRQSGCRNAPPKPGNLTGRPGCVIRPIPGARGGGGNPLRFPGPLADISRETERDLMNSSSTPSATSAEEPTRPVREVSPWHHLQQRGWLLWGAAFLVLLALAGSIPLIYWVLIQSAEDPSS